MKNIYFRKGIVIGVFFVFFGTCIIPSFNAYNLQRNNIESLPMESFDTNIMNSENNQFQNPSGLFPFWRWAKNPGATGFYGNEANDICIEQSTRDLFITGDFDEKITFTNVGSLYGDNDLYIAKLDSNQNWVWAQGAGGPDRDAGEGICIDESRNTYVTGFFQNTSQFGATSMKSKGGKDIFVAKLDINGDWVWVQQFFTEYDDSGVDICVDNNGSIYVTGYMDQWKYIFVLKLDAITGAIQWLESVGESSHVESLAICVDGDESVYITGQFRDTVTFGNYTLTATRDDVFIAKLNASRTWEWAEMASGSYPECGYGICEDGLGNIYVTGYFEGTADFGGTHLSTGGLNEDVFISKLSADGTWIWTEQGGGSGWDDERGQDICIDGAGNIFITGNFYGNSQFGTTILNSGPCIEVFVAKMDQNRNWEWAIQAKCDSENNGYGICTDGHGNIYVVGFFRTTSSNYIDFGRHQLQSSPDYSTFIACVTQGPHVETTPDHGFVYIGRYLRFPISSSIAIIIGGMDFEAIVNNSSLIEEIKSVTFYVDNKSYYQVNETPFLWKMGFISEFRGFHNVKIEVLSYSGYVYSETIKVLKLF